VNQNFAGIVFGRSSVKEPLFFYNVTKTWPSISQLLFLIVTINEHAELPPLKFHSFWEKTIYQGVYMFGNQVSLIQFD
jgi:hypothetical protein